MWRIEHHWRIHAVISSSCSTITLKDPTELWCRDAADAKGKAIIIAKHVVVACKA
jgi:hypothetical protein